MKNTFKGALALLLGAGALSHAVAAPAYTRDDETERWSDIAKNTLGDFPLDPDAPITVKITGPADKDGYPTGEIYYNDNFMCGKNYYRYFPSSVYYVDGQGWAPDYDDDKSTSLIKKANNSYDYGWVIKNGDGYSTTLGGELPAESITFYGDCGKHKIGTSIKTIIEMAYKSGVGRNRARLTIDRLLYSENKLKNMDEGSSSMWKNDNGTNDYNNLRLGRAYYYLYLTKSTKYSSYKCKSKDCNMVDAMNYGLSKDSVYDFEFVEYAVEFANVKIFNQHRHRTWSDGKYVTGDWITDAVGSCRNNFGNGNESTCADLRGVSISRENMTHQGDSLVEFRRIWQTTVATGASSEGAHAMEVYDTTYSPILQFLPLYNVLIQSTDKGSLSKSYDTVGVVPGTTFGVTANPKVGNAFKCWAKDKGGKNCVSTQNPLELTTVYDTTLYAIYAPATYKVQFYDFGVLVKEEEVVHGEDATAPSLDSHKGLTFKSWDKEFKKIEAPTVVTAQYVPNAIPEYAFTIKGLEVGKAAKDIVIETPNDCFVKPDFTVKQWQKVNASSDVKNYLEVEKLIDESGKLTMSISISDDEACADDSLANIWKFYNDSEAEAVDYKVNGISGKIDFSKTDSEITYLFHNVNFYDYDQTILKQEFVGHGGAAELPKDPEHKGFVFKGWKTYGIDLTKVESSIGVGADYELENLDISFTVTGLEVGNTIDSIKVTTPNSCFSVTEKTLNQWNSDLSNMEKVTGALESGKKGNLVMTVAASDTGDCVDNALVNIWSYNGSRGVTVYSVNGKSGSASGSLVSYYFDAKDIEPQSSSSEANSSNSSSSQSEVESSSSSVKDKSSSSSAADAKSSSSKGGKESIFIHAQLPQFSVTTVGRDIQVAHARVGSAYAVFDMQGRVLDMGRVGAENFNLVAPRAGTYLVRVGAQSRRVAVK